MGLKYLYNKEYCYLLHLAFLRLLHYKIIYQGGIDIIVWGCMNLCIQYMTHIIRTVAIYFIPFFYKMIYNNYSKPYYFISNWYGHIAQYDVITWMGLKYLYNKEYCYLFHLNILQSLYYKMMQQTSIDIMVIGNVNPCL